MTAVLQEIARSTPRAELVLRVIWRLVAAVIIGADSERRESQSRDTPSH